MAVWLGTFLFLTRDMGKCKEEGKQAVGHIKVEEEALVCGNSSNTASGFFF